MKDLLEKKNNLINEIDNIDYTCNEQVWRVLKVFQKEKFEGDKEFSYSDGSATSLLIGNHLWPQYFDTFEITCSDELYAGGMYQGFRGYYEHETISFPATWLSLSDEELSKAIQTKWKEKKKQAARIELEEAKKEEETRRKHYEKLKKEFES